MQRRLDVELARLGLLPSRERAANAERSGTVLVNGRVVLRPSHLVTDVDRIEVTADPIPYVSRGGLKLEAALDEWRIHPGGRVCLDVGASTGGFTEVLLIRGARHVYCVDVGSGQLHPSLRSRTDVTVMEQTDIRSVQGLAEPVNLAVVDVSFISLTLVLPHVSRLLTPDGEIVALIKPQFEVGRSGLGKGGVVRDPGLHAAAIASVKPAAVLQNMEVRRTMPSPIPGGDGNREFLAWITPQSG